MKLIVYSLKIVFIKVLGITPLGEKKPKPNQTKKTHKFKPSSKKVFNQFSLMFSV